MVSNLSRRFSIVRAAMLPGIAHAKLERSGINDFPTELNTKLTLANLFNMPIACHHISLKIETC